MTRCDIEDEELTQEEQDYREQEAARVSPGEFARKMREYAGRIEEEDAE